MDQYTLKISQEVDKKIQEMKSDVEKSSYEEGMKLAKSEIEKQFRNNFEQQVSDLTNFVNFVKQQQHEVLMNNRKDVLKIIQLVLHWILQKEVKVDYVDKILPMILNHVQENQKIMIKVDPVTFDNFRNANTLLSEKFSSFKDIKVVVDDHISHPGVIVETDSNLYDATYTAQLQLVDELFSSLMESKSGSNITES